MKKLFAIVVAVLALGLVSCNKQKKNRDYDSARDDIESFRNLLDDEDNDESESYDNSSDESEGLKEIEKEYSQALKELEDLYKEDEIESSEYKKLKKELKKQKDAAIKIYKNSMNAAKGMTDESLDDALKEYQKALEESQKLMEDAENDFSY